MRCLRLLVTRPQPQADGWVERLVWAGFDAAAVPLLRTEPAEEAASPMAAALLAQADGAVFVSPAAVSHFFDSADAAARPWPSSRWAAAPGPGTAERLEAAGVPRACIVQPAANAAQFDSETLWQQLQTCVQPGRRVVIIRGEGGRDWLADTLRGAGVVVDFIQAYRRSAPLLALPEQQALDAALQAPSANLWLFSSSEAIGHLQALVPGADWSHSLALATHPRIEARARTLGCRQVWASRPSFDAVVGAVRAIAATP